MYIYHCKKDAVVSLVADSRRRLGL